MQQVRQTVIRPLVRPEVQNLATYAVNLQKSKYQIILDGNESPYPLPVTIWEEASQRLAQLELHRYPDLECRRLKEKIATYLGAGISAEEILVGNGSDEVLKNLIETFIGSGERVLSLSPTFSMYKIFTQLMGGHYLEFPLKADGTFDVKGFREMVRETKPKMIFLCSPNNPTGTVIPKKILIEIVSGYEGILVVDEAYAEFSGQTMIPELKKFPNLVITRTFSKAFGLATVRLGYMVANLPVIQEVGKVFMPYHLNGITQVLGEVVLDHLPVIQERIQELIHQRERIRRILEEEAEKGAGWRVLPSEANFLYLQGIKVGQLATAFDQAGIKVRTFSKPALSEKDPRCGNKVTEEVIRFCMGTPEENEEVIQVIRSVARAAIAVKSAQSVKAKKGETA